MKILFIVLNITGYGTFIRAFEIAKALIQMGHNMTIMASSHDIRKKAHLRVIDGVRIIEVSNFINGPTQSGWDLYNIIYRMKMIRHEHFDIVHGFETRPTVIYPALTMKRKGIPLYFDWADWFGKGGSIEERPNPILRTFLRPIETYYENHFRNSSRGTTVICRKLKERAVQLGLKDTQLCIIPNGFNLSSWSPMPIQKAKQLCHFEGKIVHIGYLGSLFPSDSILLANSFNELSQKTPDVKLVHVGKTNYKTKHYLNDHNALIETGYVDFKKMMTLLSACDILWLPFCDTLANQGRFPYKFTNYLASGRPIITTNVGDIPHYIKQYQTGIVTDDTADAISQATRNLIHDYEKSEYYANNALILSNNPKHSWASRAEDFLKFYTEGKSYIYD